MVATDESARRFRALFISDVHLGTRGCQAELLLDFIREMDCETLFLVGDIIDGAPIAILPAVNVKRMKVPAVPAHSRLDCLMQVTECHATEHQDPAPDWWLRAAQRHFQTNHTRIAYLPKRSQTACQFGDACTRPVLG